MYKLDYDKVSKYWTEKETNSIKMKREDLLSEIEKYITANDTCALATSNGKLVRCTPIEYSYVDGNFYMFSEGGLKFAALKDNKNVCMAIFDKYTGWSKLNGMQVTGTADIVEPFSDEYIKLANYKKIPIEALKKLENTMNLIKIIPTRIDYLCSDFKKKGYDSRQFIEF